MPLHKSVPSIETSGMAVLLSYPRSGNHWVRFIVEYISGRPTLGCDGSKYDKPIHTNIFIGGEKPLAHVNSSAPPVLIKSHGETRPTPHQKLVFLVRDFRECVPRQAQIAKCPPFFDLWRWIDLCKVYVQHPGPKHLIYYEDLLGNPMETVVALINFLELDDSPLERTRAYFNNMERLNTLSATATARAWNAGIAGKNTKYHQLKIARNLICDAEQKVRAHPEITQVITHYFNYH